MNKAQILQELNEQVNLIDQGDSDPTLSSWTKMKNRLKRTGYLHAIQLVTEFTPQTKINFPLKTLHGREIEGGVIYFKAGDLYLDLSVQFTHDQIMFIDWVMVASGETECLSMIFQLCDFREGVYATYQNMDPDNIIRKIHITE